MRAKGSIVLSWRREGTAHNKRRRATIFSNIWRAITHTTSGAMPEVGVAATALTDAAATANTTDSATQPAEAGCNDEKQGSSLPTDSEMNRSNRDPMPGQEGQQGGQQQQQRRHVGDDGTGQEKGGSNEEVNLRSSRAVWLSCPSSHRAQQSIPPLCVSTLIRKKERWVHIYTQRNS